MKHLKKVTAIEPGILKSVRGHLDGGVSASLRTVFRHTLECGHVETRDSECKRLRCSRCP